MNDSDFDLNFQNKNPESKIVAAFERISQAYRVLLWQECKEYALSPIQVQVLIFLLHHSEEKRKVGYLAEEFNMSKATISDTIKALEKKNLIRKVDEPNDSRSYIIDLTVTGKEIAGKTSYFTREIRAPVDKLSQDEKDTLLASLFQVIRHLNSTGIIAIQRMCLTCFYYQHATDGKQPFCKLLDLDLMPTDLRMDCPEHVMKEDDRIE